MKFSEKDDITLEKIKLIISSLVFFSNQSRQKLKKQSADTTFISLQPFILKEYYLLNIEYWILNIEGWESSVWYTKHSIELQLILLS